MKRLWAGLFLAICAFPASFAAGVLVMQHTYGGGLASALDVAAKTAAVILGLALFVFMGGLISKIEPPKPASNGDAWGKDR
ncbi:hypothetical protein ACIUZJ_24740 [Pseudomonas aeruginosa]|nr:hypothetical protein [Pseudomonas aeruginosa]HEK0202145.1 hypothetical protein [Pseudomonas aeruginosa]HEK3622382.1 hypothetical protein [Pseudomonas aeruginosa]